jgi:beta,beta-carotene 9',10'-dioxygenase
MNSGNPGHSTPYALGFTTLDQEVEGQELTVRGEFPPWLSGALIRTAPAKFEVGERSYRHWFDGLAMLHAFDFANGAVRYTNRFIQSDSYREAMATGRISRGEFMTDPCRSLFGRVMAIFQPRPTDNTNVNVSVLGGKLVALTESTLPIIFEPGSLKTLGHFEYPDEVSGQISTAHPHHDGARGYSYVIAMGRRSVYRLFSDENGTQRALAELPTERPAYMHSFGMSERFLVLAEFPLRVNPLRLVFTRKPFIRNYAWEPSLGTRFTVAEKSSGRVVARAVADPCFCFHHVNAFEDEGALHVDLLAYPDAGIIDALQLARLRNGPPVDSFATLARFRIPLEGAEETPRVQGKPLSSTRMELPRIDYSRRAGKKHRIVWGAGQSFPGNFLDCVTRIELSGDGGASVLTWREEGCHPGEPVFVARPDGTEEDDGVLLSVVLDTRDKRSFLLVLDAATLNERARAVVPHHIPFGFHGNHFPELPR